MSDPSMFDDVHAFHAKFRLLRHEDPGHLSHRKLLERTQFMMEELHEFMVASATQSLEGQADALVDLVYVALGTAVMLGLPWADLWDEVQRANMEKVRGVGPRGHLEDVIKPEGWEPPAIDAVLSQAGYEKEAWRALLEHAAGDAIDMDDGDDDEPSEV